MKEKPIATASLLAFGGICVLLGVAGASLVSEFSGGKLTGTTVAAWVQAFGAVGAIAGTAALTKWQLHQTQRDRYASFALGIKALFQHAMLPVDDLIEDLNKWKTTEPEEIDLDILRDVIDAVRSFPLHELANSDIISCALSLQVMLRRIQDAPKAIHYAQAIGTAPDAFTENAKNTKEALQIFLDLCDDYITAVQTNPV